MRRLNLIYNIPFLLLLLGLSACVSEDLSRPVGKGMGYLRLALGDISSAVSAEVETKAGTLTLPEAYMPATTDFMIDIKQGGISLEGYPKPFSEVEGQTLELSTSIYTIEAYAGTNEIIQKNPYFYGSKEVRIVPGESLEESIETSLGNTMLVSVVNDHLKKHYTDWRLKVKVGETSEILVSNEAPEGVLFARSGQAVKNLFEGTNLLGKQTSKEWDLVDQVEACKVYIVRCNPDLSAFSNVQLQAVAMPTYEGDLLTGSNITLGCQANGAPIELVENWMISVLYNDTPIRTYSGNNLTDAMTEVEGWPYVPKGCKLLASIRLRTGEEFELSPADVTVSEPQFSVSVSGRTSYSVYADEHNTTAANAINGSSIIDIVATASICEDILNNPNYRNLLKSSYKTDTGKDSGELVYGIKTQFTSLAWQKHVLTATVVFDGTESVSTPFDCHVTGLPYRAEPPTQDKWRKEEGDIKWNGDHVRLGNYSTSQPHSIISNNFYIPEEVNVEVATRYFVQGGAVGTTFSLFIGTNELFKTAVDGAVINYKSATVEESRPSILSPSNNYVKCNNSYGSGRTHSEVFYVKISYR